MNFECYNCKKLVDDTRVIFKLEFVNSGSSSLVPFCPLCYEVK